MFFLPGILLASMGFGAEADVRVAAGRSVKLLQQAMNQWKQDCVSCHHQTLPVIALGVAREHGIAIDEAAAQAASNAIFAKLYSSTDNAVQYPMAIDPGITDGHELTAAHAAGVKPSLTTRIAARRLARWQKPDGSWALSDGRPPASSSKFTSTALSARAVSLYAPSPQPTLGRARQWLLQTKPHSMEDHTYRLLGLLWTAAPEAERKRAASQLLALANADGGWSQEPGLPSDPYSTAQASFALRHAAGLQAPKAIDYLLRTQKADGSWLAETRIHTQAPISPPYFDSGFPHARNQFLSCAATAWAVMALAATLPRSPKAPLPVTSALPKDAAPWMESLTDPKPSTSGGTTALMLAAHDPALVKALLDRGADVKARAKSGFDALTAAAQYPGNAETLRLLLARGAETKPGAGKRFPLTPLTFTAMHGDVAMAEILLKHGASPEQPSTVLGFIPVRPFESASLFEHEAMMRALVRHGAKADSLDPMKMTPLSWAALQHKSTAAGVLLELGANPNHIDGLKLTPLQHTTAIRHSSSETAAKLRAAGARSPAR
ncbi:MAG: ankyrin repeat domain-containing protein [Bryobacterales bacterium]|nr:ankyrin repeat domain-containing protein [Bryobacterales bacterium]